MPSVIFLEKPAVALANAWSFGEVKVLYPTNKQRPSFFDPVYALDLLERLEEIEYNPEIDYIAVTGSIAQIVISTLHLMVHCGTINLLVFNAARQCYVSVKVPSHAKSNR